jgi:F-type H+-transporting ATPase subunit delta
MKITATQYAQSLYESVAEKSHSEIDNAVKNFVKILTKNKQIKNAPKIISKFKEIFNKENNIIEAEITTRENMNVGMRNYVSKYVSNKYKAEKVEINNIANESIKGGVIIKVGDEITDGSVERNLEELKNKLMA